MPELFVIVVVVGGLWGIHTLLRAVAPELFWHAVLVEVSPPTRRPDGRLFVRAVYSDGQKFDLPWYDGISTVGTVVRHARTGRAVHAGLALKVLKDVEAHLWRLEGPHDG